MTPQSSLHTKTYLRYKVTLQHDLNALNNWFYESGLTLNCPETNILLFGTNKHLANVNKLTLKLDETTVSHNIALINQIFRANDGQ